MIEQDAVVVGGGISGLAIAHVLASAGLGVELWESESRVGGKISSVARDGYVLDDAASMVLDLRNEIDAFIAGIGLASSKLPRAPGARRYVLNGRRLTEVPSSFGALLSTRMLGGIGKLRLLAEPLVARGCDPHESVARFVARRLGKEFLEKAFEPYIAGPLASDVERAEAATTIPQLVALEKRYGSLALGVLLARIARRGRAVRPQAFSFRGGMETLVTGLADTRRFRIRTGLRASEIEPVGGGWRLSGSDAARDYAVSARHLIISTPAAAAAGLLRGLDGELASLLGGIEYAPIRVVHTGFESARVKHPLDGSGFLLPRRSGFEVNGCLWISRLFADRAPAERTLLTSYLGGARNPAARDWSEQRCMDAVMPMLRDLLGVDGEPEMIRIATHGRGLPLYHGNYSARLALVSERLRRLPGLHLEANYRGGVSVRDRILNAQSVAQRILRQPRGEAVAPAIFDGRPILAAAVPGPGGLR